MPERSGRSLMALRSRTSSRGSDLARDRARARAGLAAGRAPDVDEAVDLIAVRAMADPAQLDDPDAVRRAGQRPQLVRDLGDRGVAHLHAALDARRQHDD